MRLTIRVLVVDDSALIRQMLVRALSMDPRIEVVGTAKNGVEAIDKASSLNPDVITLDVEMPELSGLEALSHIRKRSDARVIMLSSATDADTMYRALSLGAVDFIAKPGTGVASSITELTELLLKKIRIAHRASPTPPAGEQSAAGAVGLQRAGDGLGAVEEHESPQTVVAIASSTGGPPALERVFRDLSGSLSTAYLVVQHLPAGFSASLAKRLSGVGAVPIAEAVQGEPILRGRAYLAPYGRHMTIARENGAAFIRLLDEPPRHGVRPAADLLFESVAGTYGPNGIGVVLTGMGSDGARGSLAIRAAGGDVLVQDEETSVIWGMPGSALKIGASNRSVPVESIAVEIRRAVRTRVGVHAGA